VETGRPARYRGAYGTWVPGLVLITLGLVFLAQNYLNVRLHNWWALFLLIPAFSGFARAVDLTRSGQGAAATGPLVGVGAFVLLTVIFLFDLPFGQLWPVLLILAGVGLLFSRRSWTLGP
jgi:cell wall-active antibiotic response 4TMS protein YvqF